MDNRRGRILTTLRSVFAEYRETVVISDQSYNHERLFTVLG